MKLTVLNKQFILKVIFELQINCKLYQIFLVRSNMIMEVINGLSSLIFHSIVSSLQTCSRVLLPPQEKKHFLDQLSRPAVSSLIKKGLKKKIVEKCKKISHCPYCEALNGKHSWTLSRNVWMPCNFDLKPNSLTFFVCIQSFTIINVVLIFF